MPRKAKESLANYTKARAKAQNAGKEILAKYEEQVASLSQLAEQYLDQGLLGHHCEAAEMRDKALQTLKDTREKLGLAEPPATTSASTPSPTTSSAPSAQAQGRRAGHSDSLEEAKLSQAQTANPGPAKAQTPGPATQEAPPAWSTAVRRAEVRPRYRWRPLCEAEGAGALLEVSEVAGLCDGQLPEVDVAEVAVRLQWPAIETTLTLFTGFSVDLDRCRVVRRRRGNLRLLCVSLPRAHPSTPPLVDTLGEGVAGAEGWGFVDGFLAGAEAEALRTHLLGVWQAGRFVPGDLEGGAGANTRAAGELVRSDEHLYVEEAGPVQDFTRQLDRAMLQVVPRVASLSGKRLLRGRPMAATYAAAGARYAPHFDAVAGDNGRLLTCILYLNPFWRQGDGAELRLWPSARGLSRNGPCREVAPLHGRLLVFLCDGRNLHEVCPVTEDSQSEPRLAISCWYYDSEAIATARERPGDTPEAME